MTDAEQTPRSARSAAQLGPTGRHIGALLRRVREGRGLTTAQLSARLRQLQRPFSPPSVTKVEQGKRQVTVDDLMAYGVALNVAPSALLLPVRPYMLGGTDEWVHALPSPDEPGAPSIVGYAEPIEVAEGVEVSPAAAIAWLRGDRALPRTTASEAHPDDQQAYELYSLDPAERQARRSAAVRLVDQLAADVRQAALTVDVDVSGAEDESYGSFWRHLEDARARLAQVTAELDVMERQRKSVHRQLRQWIEASRSRDREGDDSGSGVD